MLDESAATLPLERLADHLSTLISTRAPALAMLSRRLDVRPGRWPRWVPVGTVRVADQLRVRTVGPGCEQTWPGAVEEFFGAATPTDRPPWQLQLMREVGTGRTAVLATMHHALGDGVAVTDALLRLLADHPPGVTAPAEQSRPPSSALRRWAGRAARARSVLRGLVSLAGAALPPPDGLAGSSTVARRYATAELSAAKVRAVARERRVSSSALLLTVVAGGLHQLLESRGGTVQGQRLRAMVPRSTRRTRCGAEGGNWTAAMSMDLPVGPMPAAQRLADVAGALTGVESSGQPAATDAVMLAQGLLPTRLHSRLVRLICGRRFFNLIISVLPGSRRDHRVAGARVSAVFPVLSLGTVGLAVGMISWADVLAIGVTADPAVLEDVDDFADCLRLAFDDIAASPAEGV